MDRVGRAQGRAFQKEKEKIKMIAEYLASVAEKAPTITAGAITLGSLLLLKKSLRGHDLLFNYSTPYGRPFRFLEGKSVDEAILEASKFEAEYGIKVTAIEKKSSGCFLYRPPDRWATGLREDISQQIGKDELIVLE